MKKVGTSLWKVAFTCRKYVCIFLILCVQFPLWVEESAGSKARITAYSAFAEKVTVLDAAVTAASQNKDDAAVVSALKEFSSGLLNILKTMAADTVSESENTKTTAERSAIQDAQNASSVFSTVHTRIEWCIGNSDVQTAWESVMNIIEKSAS
jgi:hypothetical protein